MMAEVHYTRGTGVPDLELSFSQKPECKHCSGYLSEIASLYTKLQSARKIIQLLHVDLYGIKNQPPLSEYTSHVIRLKAERLYRQ